MRRLVAPSSSTGPRSAGNAADYTLWRDGLGSTYNQNDYTIWKNNFGATSTSLRAGSSPTPAAVPEPTTGAVPAMAVLMLADGK